MNQTERNLLPLVIYHAECADGIAAAWVLWKKFNKAVELLAAKYGDSPPTDEMVEGRDIYIVDFSYSALAIQEMSYVAKHITVIDHHETAVKNLMTGAFPSNVTLYIEEGDKAGCILVWEYCHGEDSQAPYLLRCIADRDLWKFKLIATEAVCAGFYSYPLTVELVDEHVNQIVAITLGGQGHAILRAEKQQIATLMEGSFHKLLIKGYLAAACNAPKFLASSLAHAMLEEYSGVDFAAVYHYSHKGWEFSLRGREGGINVADIASQYGGGGHPKAAGFVVANLTEL